MASEDHDDGGVSFALPDEVDDWVADTADRRDETRDDVCRRLVTAAHAIATDDEVDPVDRDDVDDLQGQLDAQREEFVELLEDVRSRVVQVKRETDAKAPAAHDHDEYATAEAVADLEADLGTLEETVTGGFDNFEDVLEHLLDRTDDLEDRSTVLATAVVDLRDRRDALAERERRRAETERLKLAANRLGIRTATCEECGSAVDLALLTRPECPHCGRTIAEVAAKSSIFGSHTLETGEPPALESHAQTAVGSTSDEVFEAVEADADDGGTGDESDAPTPNRTGDGEANR
ncbi:hypothetical protein ACFO5R_09430 [Halosolutus amylolyticus]|uniref:CopG family transcriptional regulator n=1 Tax=Halosolutus amylolyticus TaxID=2932267 RepID=A0ABD5PNZ4_9EURY|nr:hypothetical protein [Halosolutus amylolyticus]